MRNNCANTIPATVSVRTERKKSISQDTLAYSTGLHACFPLILSFLAEPLKKRGGFTEYIGVLHKGN
jgi:hypothetical protein